jgi:outer membrane protein OmpA-like peptidoglycan-associated protein
VDTIVEQIILTKPVPIAIPKPGKDAVCGSIMLKLTVTDSVTRERLNNVDVRLHQRLNNMNYDSRRIDSNGTLNYRLERNQMYFIEVIRPKYKTHYDTITATECALGRDITVSKEVKLVRNDTFDIVIQFGFDSANVTMDAQKSLEILVAYMKDSSTDHVRLIAHADCRGDSLYNKRLSNKRADSVFHYLLRKGIYADRIDTFYGVGEAYQKIECCNCNSRPPGEKTKKTKKQISDDLKKDEKACTGSVPCQEKDHYQNRRMQFILIRQET